jgi:Rrf2 family transcriptional regulator, cysteine metabolism repressor
VWIARRTDYAARAVLALAIAGDGNQLTLDELVERTVVPRSVLEQVMPTLRTAAIVRATRGRYGGYSLNKPPAEISLETIVRLFQGPLAPIDCATRKNPEPCEMREGCSMHGVWAGIRDATIAALRQATFEQLADDAEGAWAHRQPTVARP